MLGLDMKMLDYMNINLIALDKVLPVPLLVGQSYLNSEHNKSFKLETNN